MAKYFDKPAVELNMDDIDPNDPNFADIIDRQLYFPNPKF